MINFQNINYLQTGNARQKLAYLELMKLKIFDLLSDYQPILTGTIPIDIDTPESDLDLICCCSNHVQFAEQLTSFFGQQKNFKLNTHYYNDIKCTIATFQTTNFVIEIFGQNMPTAQQNAYRHMLIEYRVLQEKGAAFKAEVQKLKQAGWKTEPAFAKLLGLSGDPYEALLMINDQ